MKRSATETHRADEIFDGVRDQVMVETNQLFAKLLVAQWIFAIGLALATSPWTYEGDTRVLHFHVKLAIGFGALINALPLTLVYLRPTWWGTRHTVAAVQMMWSAVLITITNGRIETHFHVFGSLAFLAIYRDWKVLGTATLVVAAEHLARGLWWPDSIYGIGNPEWWRFLEHAGWVVFEDAVLVYACVRGARQMRALAENEARLERMMSSVERQVTDRTAELQVTMQRYRSLVEDTAAVPFELSLNPARMQYLAASATKLFDCTAEQLEDTQFLGSLIHPDDVESMFTAMRSYSEGSGPSEPIYYRMTTRAGRLLHLKTLLSSRTDGLIRGLTFDITKERRLELELQQAQKLESVGRLAAGVAHEINTPVQFVSDSVAFVRASACELIDLVRLQQSVIETLVIQPAPELVRACDQAAAAIDLSYLSVEVPKALDRAVEGLDRVATIVRGLKVFAHPASGLSAIDLNRAVDSTLTIARNEYRYVADLVTDLGELPKITCHAGEINQAILNIVLNASHAITDLSSRTKERGTLKVATRCEGDDVVVSIADTGPGIPEHVQRKMFDPFFTTKPVGRGTGQGLAIARAIVAKHRGSLTFQTKVGVGTTFFLRIPIASSPTPAEHAA